MSVVVGYLIGQVGEMSGLRVAVPDSGLIIGRDPKQAGLVIDYGLISRRHAQIAVHTDGRLYLVDLQSRNGTFVNGHELTAPAPLQTNDKIEFGAEGKVVFLYESADTTSVSGVLKEAFGETVAPVEWKVGDNILGIYEVTGILGQGGMGRVYKVHHKSWNMDLAVKSPRPELLADERAVEDFIREAETWVNLNLHPNIVQCFYVRTIGGIPRIFSEYVPGGTLHDWIKQKKLTQLDQILDVAIQFAWGLHAAHEQGIVHQDVKPLNVLMTPDGIAKVSDFGLARSRPVTKDKAITTPDNMVTMAGVFTTAYCSPEQAHGEKLSRKTDIWSWAVSVLEMFTGGIVWQNGLQAPAVLKAYRSLLGPKFIVKMPKALAKILEQCLRVKPDDRPEGVGDLATSLQEIHRVSCREDYHRPEPKAAGKHIADSLNNRAVSALDLGKQAEAIRLWDEALKAEPHHPDATYNDALIQWRLARIGDDEAVQRLKEVCGSHQDNWLPDYLLAQCHIERDDCYSAIEVLEEIGETPSNRDFLRAATERAQARLANSTRVVREFIGHQDDITCLCAAEDNHLILSGSSDKTLRLWDTATGACARTLAGHRNVVTCAAFSRDGQYVVSGSTDQSVKLWGVRTGQCLQTFEADGFIPHCLYMTADGRFVISGSRSNIWFDWEREITVTEESVIELRIWEVSTSRCVQRISGLTGETGLVSIGADGNFSLSVSEMDNLIGLWNVRTGKRLRVLKGHTGEIMAACLSHDGRFVLSAAGEFKLWEAATGRCLKTFGEHADINDEPTHLAWNGRLAIAGDSSGLIRLWDVSTGKCLRTFESWRENAGAVLYLARDGRFALSGNYDNVIEQFQVRDNPNSYSAPLSLCRAVKSESLLAAASDYEEALQHARLEIQRGNSIAALRCVRRARSQFGHARAREALELVGDLYLRLPHKAFKAKWEKRVLGEHTQIVSSVRVNANGKHVLSGSFDASIKLWDIGSGKCVSTLSGHEDPVESVFLSSDGRYALSGSDDRTLKLWDLNRGKCLRTFEGHTNGVSSVCLSADGKYALSGSRDATIRLWEVASGKCLRKFDTLGESTRSAVSLTSDGRFALSNGGRNNKDIKLWDLVSGICVRVLVGHDSLVQKFCLTNDGRHLFSCSSDNTLRQWELASGNCLRIFKGHTGPVLSASVTADGHYIFSSSSDRTLRLWEVATGKCIHSYEQSLRCRGLSLHLSCNGQYLAYDGVDCTVRLWRLDWDLEEREPADWDEGARPYLENFLTRHTPYAAKLPIDRQPTDEEVALALTRRGRPVWSENDFEGLFYELGCAGYGWLRPGGVRRELERMVGTWQEPPPLIVS